MYSGLTEAVALIGAVTGIAGMVLGIVNYLRDRAKIVVNLQWDLASLDNPRYDRNKLWGIVSVSNVGRRPIYIRLVNLELPKGYKHTNLLINEGMAGTKLAEGDAPAIYVVTQDGLEKYKKDWNRIRAAVYDTAGKTYRSKVKRTEPPSWAR
jgi:hypothetical protein